MRLLVLHIIFLLFLVFSPKLATAQIDFSGFSSQYSTGGNYAVSAIDLNDYSLEFGELLNDEGDVSIELLNSETLIFELSGVKYLDLFITVFAENLKTAGCGASSCEIPFTLGASYANRGANNKAHATPIIIDLSNNGDVVFPIRYRGNVPPGPPPTPFYEGYVPETDKAYLYIYGSLDVGMQDSGNYSTAIVVTVNYD